MTAHAPRCASTRGASNAAKVVVYMKESHVRSLSGSAIRISGYVVKAEACRLGDNAIGMAGICNERRRKLAWYDKEERKTKWYGGMINVFDIMTCLFYGGWRATGSARRVCTDGGGGMAAA